MRLGRLAHAGTGIAHLVLQPELELGWPEKLPGLVSELAELAAGFSGRAALLSAPTELKARLPVLDQDDPEREGRRRLKQQWDPHNLFNPGRLP